MSDFRRLGAVLNTGMPTEAEIDAKIAARHQRAKDSRAAIAAYWASFKAEPKTMHPITEPVDGLADCPTCKGGRWVKRPVQGGEPWQTEVLRCPDCPGDVREAQAEQWAEVIGLDNTQVCKTFSAFSDRTGAVEARGICEAWAKNPSGWLVLHGLPGCGKTHLSLAVVNRLMATGRAVRWHYGSELMAAVKQRMDTNEHTAFIERLKASSIFVLDDLGTARSTDFNIRDVLEPLFDYRYRHRLPTLVTMIGTPKAVKEQLSESIGRRMQDESVCRVVGITAGQYGGKP